jgi:O-antigen/teichoic acid export membrane protein
MFAERVIKLLLSFLIGLFLVRYLGPEQFGVLAYAVSFALLFASIANFGLENILVRELVSFPEQRKSILGSAFILRIIGSIIVLLVTVLAVKLNNETDDVAILIYLISAGTIFQAFHVVDFYFQGKVQAKFSATVQSSSVILVSLLRLLFILFSGGLVWFAVVQALEPIFIAIGFVIVYYYNKENILQWQFKKDVAKRLFHDSWPLILAGLVVSIYIRIDQILIKNMLSSEQNGYYAAAVRLCEAWYFIPMAISSSLYPAIVNAKVMSEELYQSRLQKLYDLLAAISIFIAIPVTIFSELIITFLFGDKFAPAAPVLTIYIWAGIATFLGVASSQYLVTENLTKVSFLRTLIGLILNVALNLLLIPTMGITGSALATLISYSVATFGIVLHKKSAHQAVMMIKALLLINIIKLVISKWQSLSQSK